MSKVVVQRENAIKIYQHCIVKLNYIYNQEKSRKHQYALYKITADYLKDKLNSIVQTDAKQLIFHVSKELLTIYETPTGNQKQELLRNFAVTYYESLSQIQNLDYTAVLDVTLDEIEGELSDEELEKIEKEEAEKLILENGNPRQEENNNNNNLNQNIHNEEEEIMAPTAKEVATFVKDIFPATFDGSSGTIDSAIDAIDALMQLVPENLPLVLTLIKPKCIGVAHALATSAATLAELRNLFRTSFKKETKEEAKAKLESISRGNSSKENFAKEVEKCAERLKMVFIENDYSIKNAEEDTIQLVAKVLANNVGPKLANRNKFVGAGFKSVGEALGVYRAIESMKEEATVHSIGTKNNFRGRGRRGNRGNRGGYQQNNYNNNNGYNNNGYNNNGYNRRGRRGRGNRGYNNNNGYNNGYNNNGYNQQNNRYGQYAIEEVNNQNNNQNQNNRNVNQNNNNAQGNY